MHLRINSATLPKILAFGSLVACLNLVAGESLTIQDLQREVDSLRKQVSTRPAGESALQNRIKESVDGHVLVNAPVKTRSGKLTIGGLAQLWAYSIQNDTIGFMDINQIGPGAGGTSARNKEADNDSFRIRRAELRFGLDIHENVSAYVMIDAAREATAFPSLPQNQSSVIGADQSAAFFNSCLCAGFIDDSRGIGAGNGVSNRLLQDAFINFHGVVPHHDFSIGQMKRNVGEEGTRDSGRLDFAERAMITQPAELRDVGAKIHGNWIDGRVQYWLGVYNGAGTAFQQRSNRSDDNDEKDGLFSLYVAPVKDNATFGTLELGYSFLMGTGGESSSDLPGTNPGNDLNRSRTTHSMQYAWGAWHAGGPVRGWWVRGEWGQIRDRFAPNESATGLDVISTDPRPFNIEGWYVSTGYRVGQSSCADHLHSALKNMEFAFRYEVMQNIFFHDLVVPERRFDLFKTQVVTLGLNYYLMNDNAKLQLNYNIVNEEENVDKDDRQFREVRNNSLVLNFQVMF
jgi:hypothetical protein